jgi:hypothetical protein
MPVDSYRLTKLEYTRISRAVDRCIESGIDGREISAVVSRREGYPEWKVDAALYLRADLAERQLAAIRMSVRNSLDAPADIERDFWEAA